MRRITSYRRIAAELPTIGTQATTRQGQVGEVIAHEDGQALLQFAGAVQGLYYPDEITWLVTGAQTEGHWQTEGAELHLADRDYPELTDILGRPAPALVQEGNEWGHVASKTASTDCPNCGSDNTDYDSNDRVRCGNCGHRFTDEDAYTGDNADRIASKTTTHETKIGQPEPGKFVPYCLSTGCGWSAEPSDEEWAKYHANEHRQQTLSLDKKAGMDQTLHAKLLMAVTEYDRKQQGKPGYNIYALPQYLGAIQRAQELCDSGDSVRDALLTCFSGRLLAVTLKAAGEPKPTNDELHWGRRGSKTAADIGPDGKRLTHEGPWNRAKNVHPDEYLAGRNAANSHSLNLTALEGMKEAERHNGAFYGDGSTEERAHHAGQADSYAEKAMSKDSGVSFSFGIGNHSFHPQEIGTVASRTADMSNPNNTDGFTETTFDPYGAFSAAPGECPTCFGEGAYSSLNPDGKGFGPEQDCADCGGTGKAS